MIVRHSDEWKRLFNLEKRRIKRKLGGLTIEHIGSTSVAGLGAKPVIDMMAAVSNFNKVKEYIEPMRALGYIYYPELEKQIPDRRFFQRRINDTPRYHISFTISFSDYSS